MHTTPEADEGGPAYDVFLSYAKEDRERAAMLVEALSSRGLSVWWDRQIAAGQNYHRTIERAIDQARCVVVLWTSDSVHSDWVAEEAALARERSKLVPAILDEVAIPVSFRLIQTADLRGWRGGDHAGIDEIERGVRTFLSTTPANPEPDRRLAPKRRRIWLTIPAAVALLLLAVSTQVRAPTMVDIAARVSRVSFAVAAEDPQELLAPISVEALSLRGFTEVRLPAAELYMAAPETYDLGRDRFAEQAWRRVLAPDAAVLRAVGPLATVSIEPGKVGTGTLSVDRLFIASTLVTLTSPDRGTLHVNVRRGGQPLAVSIPGTVQIVADHCLLVGIQTRSTSPSTTLRARSTGSPPLLEAVAGGGGVLLALRFADAGRARLVPGGGIPVSRVDFIGQGPLGAPQSKLAGPGIIRYEKAPDSSVVLKENDFLVLDNLESFRLLEMSLEDDGKLRLRLKGVAGKLSAGPEGFVRDVRLSRFDVSSGPILSFAILFGLAPLLWVGAYRFRKR
jgi:hypothetical protein